MLDDWGKLYQIGLRKCVKVKFYVFEKRLIIFFTKNTNNKIAIDAIITGIQRVNNEPVIEMAFSAVDKKELPKPAVNLVEANRKSPVPA